MINQLSNKYLVKKLVVYLDDGHKAGMLLVLFEMIDQLSSKYLLNTFMVYLDHEAGMLLDLFEMIDQLSNKYLLMINDVLPRRWSSHRNDQSIIDQVIKEIYSLYFTHQVLFFGQHASFYLWENDQLLTKYSVRI